MKEKFGSSRENEALLRHFEFRRKYEWWGGPWYKMTVSEIVERLTELTGHPWFSARVIGKLLDNYNCPKRTREDGKICFVLREKVFKVRPSAINVTINITIHEENI